MLGSSYELEPLVTPGTVAGNNIDPEGDEYIDGPSVFVARTLNVYVDLL